MERRSSIIVGKVHGIFSQFDKDRVRDVMSHVLLEPVHCGLPPSQKGLLNC